ncbi:MAG TPA: hypothetical protein VFA33_05245 [Bryobacteraceae bacterium]|nr:hypothetical protein [Bryobacteraceae bacterium]
MEPNPNPNLAPAVTHQPTLLGGAENIKLLFDEELDSRRETLARQRAWEAVSLEQAQIANRRAQNAATIDHAINAGLVLAGQVGTTESQQTVSPAGIAASETTKGAVAAAGAGEAVSAEAVTANVANLFTALTPVIASALAAAISQTIAALVPVVVTASGGASTPSQTQAKPTA